MNISTEITINEPIDKVADFAANPDNAAQWHFNIKSVKWKTPKPLSVGSKLVFKSQFFRRNLIYIYEITEYVPHQKLVMRTARSSFPMQTTYVWQTNSNGQTHMTLRSKGHLGGIFKIFTPVIFTIIKKTNNKNLKKIKEILEGN